MTIDNGAQISLQIIKARRNFYGNSIVEQLNLEAFYILRLHLYWDHINYMCEFRELPQQFRHTNNW